MQKIFMKNKTIWRVILVVVVIVSCVWILAPLGVRYYLNNKIFADMGSYTGYVEDVDVNLIAGSYALNNLTIWPKDGYKEVPFFYAEEFFIGVSWEALIRGELLATAAVKNAELNFLDADKSEKRQTGKGTDWRDVLDALIPITLHRFEVSDSSITFQNFDAQPNVDVRARDIEAVVTNLTNVKDAAGRRVAKAQLQATILEDAPLIANADFDPFDFNDFVFAAELQNIDLTQINNLTMHYANLDFASGHGNVFAELIAEDGNLTGYIKPLLEDVDIASWEQDVEEQGDNPFQLLWEGTLGFLKTLFTNPSSKQFATQIDISGTLDDTQIDSWKAVWGVVKNAFFQALEENFEEITPFTKGASEED